MIEFCFRQCGPRLLVEKRQQTGTAKAECLSKLNQANWALNVLKFVKYYGVSRRNFSINRSMNSKLV